MIEVVFPIGPERILDLKDLASKLKSLRPTDDDDHAQGGIVEIDRWDNEGGALGTTMASQQSISALFRGRRDSIKSRRASTVRLLSEWRVSWLSRLVGMGLLSFVLLVIFGILAPR